MCCNPMHYNMLSSPLSYQDCCIVVPEKIWPKRREEGLPRKVLTNDKQRHSRLDLLDCKLLKKVPPPSPPLAITTDVIFPPPSLLPQTGFGGSPHCSPPPWLTSHPFAIFTGLPPPLHRELPKSKGDVLCIALLTQHTHTVFSCDLTMYN